MNCVECNREVVKNVGTPENPLCEECYNKLATVYSANQNDKKSSGTGKKSGVEILFLVCFAALAILMVIAFAFNLNQHFLTLFSSCILCFLCYQTLKRRRKAK